MSVRHVVIPIFVPHKGCPFDCIYCNQKTISGQTEEMTEEKMRQIVDAHLSSIREGTYVEIGFYGGSFTGIDKEQQLSFLKTANEYIAQNKVKGIRLSTRPDYINVEILDYLKEHNVNTIELGVQSLDKEVLEKSCRGHKADDVLASSALIKRYGINLGIQTMIGLPGSTREKDCLTAQKVVELSPQIVRIYPTLVIRGTYLEKMYYAGLYTPLRIEEATDLCAELLRLFEDNGINVIRVGLQPTENIREGSGSDVVAGPVHPAFRQLAQSRVSLKRIEEMIESQNLSGAQELIIRTGNSNVSDVVGQKRSNIRALKDKYGFMAVRVAADPELSGEIICHAISSTTTSTVASSTGTQQ